MTYSNSKTLTLAGLILIGSVGVVHAKANYHDGVKDTQGNTVRSTNGNCVRTNWLSDIDECASAKRIEQVQKTVVKQAVKQPPKMRTEVELSKEERTIYFKFNKSDLSTEAKERLSTLAKVLKANESVKETVIVGYADRIGKVPYNEKLSQKRAETVRDYLIANGYTNARVTETRWVGESEPSTNCPALKSRSKLIECLQKDRKVEAEIVYLSEEQVPVTR